MGLFSFFKKQQPSVAFSFDNGSLRWVSVVWDKGYVQVDRYGSEFLGPLVMDEFGNIVDDALFVKKLRTISQADKGAPVFEEVNVVVPDHQAIMFHTHVAKMPDRQMGDVIMDHIKTYCEAHDLLELKDYVCEYDVVLETDFGYEVHVTLVPRRYMDHLARLFKQAGILVRHIETAHHAVATSCLEINQGSAHVLVSVGRKTTGIVIANAGHAVARSIVPVGADHVAATVEKYLHTSRDEALRIVARHGVLQTHPDNGLLSELHLQAAPIWREVDRQLVLIGQMPYKTAGYRFTVDQILVYGEGVGIKGLAQLLGEQTGLRASELDVWSGHIGRRAPVVNLPAAESLVYAEPLSLALSYLT